MLQAYLKRFVKPISNFFLEQLLVFVVEDIVLVGLQFVFLLEPRLNDAAESVVRWGELCCNLNASALLDAHRSLELFPEVLFQLGHLALRELLQIILFETFVFFYYELVLLDLHNRFVLVLVVHTHKSKRVLSAQEDSQEHIFALPVEVKLLDLDDFVGLVELVDLMHLCICLAHCDVFLFVFGVIVVRSYVLELVFTILQELPFFDFLPVQLVICVDYLNEQNFLVAVLH